MRISVIILAWNGERFLEPCLAALLAQADKEAEIIVVDNGSRDNSGTLAEQHGPRVRLIRNGYNLGFAGGNNVGLRAATGEAVVLLNQDTVVQPGWLSALASTFADSAIGIVGCKALYPDGRTLQHAGARVHPGNAYTEHIGSGEPDTGQYDRLADVDYVTGAAFAIHRRALERLGGLDEGFYPAYYEEIDYCYRARRAGFRVVYQPQAVLHHHETSSLPQPSYVHYRAVHRNRVRFILRHWDDEGLAAFAEVEEHAIGMILSLDDAAARARAYWDNWLGFSSIVSQRRSDPTLGPALTEAQERRTLDALLALRRRAQARLYDMLPSAPPPFDLPGVDGAGLAADLSHLRPLWEHVEERAFAPASTMPVLGPLITRFRAFWLALVVRPYVDPILRQLLIEAAHQATVTQRLAEVLSADDAAILETIWPTLKALDSGLSWMRMQPDE
jgi:GT2 family glycosyltransferase